MQNESGEEMSYRIKPLEWTGGKGHWFARTPLCNYSISHDRYEQKYFSFVPGQYRWHRTLEAAKAACEANYKATLKLCLLKVESLNA